MRLCDDEKDEYIREDETELRIIAGADRSLSPDLERFKYERVGAGTTTIAPASREVCISHPDKVAAVIADAAGDWHVRPHLPTPIDLPMHVLSRLCTSPGRPQVKT